MIQERELTPAQKFEIEAKARIKRWRADWVVAAHEIFGVILDEEQKQIIHAAQHDQRISVASGTSRGKDFCAAIAALLFLYLKPTWNEKGEMVSNAKVICSAPTDRQIENIMVPEWSKLFNKARARGIHLPGRLVGYDIRTDFKEWFLTGFKADEKNHEAWSGLHAVHIFFIFTEASGIVQNIWDAVEGNMQGDSKMMIMFNPNTPVGFAAETQRSIRWSKFRLNSLNAPNVKEKKIIIPGQVDYPWVKDKIDTWCTRIDQAQRSELENDFEFEGIWYRPTDLFRVKVLGLFPKVAGDVLVPGSWIDMANKRWEEAQKDRILDPHGSISSTGDSYKMKFPLRLGVDVAGMGRDNSAFAYRHGIYVSKFTLMHGRGEAIHMQVAGNVLNEMRLHTDTFRGLHPQAFIDTIGEGAGVYSRLQELTDETNNPVIDYKGILKDKVFSVKFSAAAKTGDVPLVDATKEYTFLNMRAYLYWSLRDWLNPHNKEKALLPYNENLYKQLTQTLWFFRSDGRIQIEEKEELIERIKMSPDEADALAQTFFPVPDIDVRPVKKQSAARFFNGLP